MQILVCSSEPLTGLLFELAPLPLSKLPVHCSPSGVSMAKREWPMCWSPSGVSLVLAWHVAVGDLQPNAHTHQCVLLKVLIVFDIYEVGAKIIAVLDREF